MSGLLFVVSLLLSASSFAENKIHSLALHYDKSDDVIEIPFLEREYSLQPETVELSYSYQYSEQVILSVSSLRGRHDDSNSFELESKLSDYSASVSYLMGLWSWDFGFSVFRDDSALSTTLPSTELFSALPTPFDIDIRYNEEYRSTDFFVGGSYDLEWRDFILTPSLRLGHQTSELESLLEGGRSNFNAYVDTKDESSGGYLAPALSMAYLWAGSDMLLWLPSVSLSWSEIIWGDIDSRSSMRLLGNDSTANSTESAKSGAGLISTSLMLVFDAFYTDLSFSQTINTEPKSKSVSLLLGLNF